MSEPSSLATPTGFGLASPHGLAPRGLFTARLGIPVNICDPFDHGLVHEPFRLRPEAFLAVARSNRPRYPLARVSAFSEWIHSLYAPPSKAETLERRRQAEIEMFQRRTEILRSETLWTNASYDWELEHNGLRIDTFEDQKITYFEIPKLCVDGQPLRGNPDLVYRNDLTGDAIVVELKFTRRQIPSNLWPDIWAQLWAYSKIPIIAAAPSLCVVGEIWGESWGWEESRPRSYQKSDRPHQFQGIYLRALVRRDPTKPSFDHFFQSLFDIYAGCKE